MANRRSTAALVPQIGLGDRRTAELVRERPRALLAVVVVDEDTRALGRERARARRADAARRTGDEHAAVAPSRSPRRVRYSRGLSVDVVRRSYEAFARGDLDAVLADMHPEIEWHQAQGLPHGGLYRGLDEVRANVFDPLDRDWWSEFSADPEEFLDAGGEVVVLGRYRGVAKETRPCARRPLRARLDRARREGSAIPPVSRHARLGRCPRGRALICFHTASRGTGHAGGELRNGGRRASNKHASADV